MVQPVARLKLAVDSLLCRQGPKGIISQKGGSLQTLESGEKSGYVSYDQEPKHTKTMAFSSIFLTTKIMLALDTGLLINSQLLHDCP